jgi:hypothetical protein
MKERKTKTKTKTKMLSRHQIRLANRPPAREDSPRTDETEVKRSFWFRRPDRWVINRKTKMIVYMSWK